ncbi:hypothetical protein OK349_05160 [Sphingomonas sp. BT-65]|uniref:hypothetical protein n=1 Tax=Sphingomonas sp. BT-65 TaxID=2989821 RepID=UPI0022368CEF|nr:hypothetical protein [Sphingomonas sp. BT-65]MCW4461087.1 hypothetical protein [Sphingomonas sp. BT-65]
MNAITPTEADYAFDHAAFHELEPGVPDATRYDGWTAEKQKRFLTALSRGLNVTQACAIVDMSRQSAYALRTSAKGAAFRLGWDAALLHARDALADELMDRAFNGVRESVTSDDGRITTRHRHDNFLAWRMLNRLDKRADAACTDANVVAVRLAAADFEQLLELIAQEAAPARAGLFLAARLGACAAEASEDDLAPIRALARADRWLRTHTDVAQGIADLDPANRASWTGEQWARAEAAGLVQLAPAPPPQPAEPEMDADTRDLYQLRQLDAERRAQRVWWCEYANGWRTNFPPPADFDGEQEGEPDDEGYERELTPDEEDAVEALRARDLAPFIAAGLAEREAWLAACREEENSPSPSGKGLGWGRLGDEEEEEEEPAMT